MDQAMWLRDEVVYRCGQRRCPELRIGLVVPQKAPSAEAWATRANTSYAQRGPYA
jgi:hypothetical protein